MKKIAFSGSSGSGKTTLVNWVATELELPHISSSAGDLLTTTDIDKLRNSPFDYLGDGHEAVIVHSAINPAFAFAFQKNVLDRRGDIIFNIHPEFSYRDDVGFVTDRSPADNIVYFMTQAAYHKAISDEITEEFLKLAQTAWDELTHVIYIKAVQPDSVEDNGSRIPNKYYQKSIDALFQYWINDYLVPNTNPDRGPKLLTIDYWDLNKRKQEVLDFLS